jgi:hypothetical protein
MFSRVRWTLLGVGALVMLSGGASIFGRPEREVLYNMHRLPPICHAEGCTVLYNLEVGNTGKLDQEQVLIRLRSAALQTALLKPTVRNFGKVERPVGVTEENGVRTYTLGRLDPQARVELQLVLHSQDAGSAPSWEEIFVGVEAPGADLNRGDPEATTLGRVLFALFGTAWW